MSNPIKHRIKLEADTQKVSITEITGKIGKSRSWWYDVTDESLGVQDLIGIARILKKPTSFFLEEKQDTKSRTTRVMLDFEMDDLIQIDVRNSKLQILKK